MEQQPVDPWDAIRELKGAILHSYLYPRRTYHPQDAEPAPRETYLRVFYGGRYDGDWPSEDAAGFLAWFQDKIAEVPAEHRGAIRIELSSESGYEDSHYASIEITYTRLETPEEVADRQEGWRLQKAQQDAAQMAEYERLKAKFG
jgi:hypothetical protein